MWSIRQHLLLQRNWLLYQGKLEFHVIQYYLWHQYLIRPIYFHQGHCREAIEHLGKIMHNPSEKTKFYSNGNLSQDEVLIRPKIKAAFLFFRLPKYEKKLTYVACRPREGQYLALLYDLGLLLPQA